MASAQPLPVCVEAVLYFGYPKDLVLATYRQLCRESSHNVAGTGHNPTGAASAVHVAPTRITAAVLMSSVDAILGQTTVRSSSYSAHRQQDSLSEVGRGVGNDVEGDCPGGEEEEAQASASSTEASGSNPDPPRTAPARDTPHTTEVNATTLSTSTAAGVVPPPSARSTSTGFHAGAEMAPASGSTSDATAASESHASPADVSQASVSPASPSVLPTSHTPTTTSYSPSAPPSGSATERQSTPAEERTRERRRQQARLRALREENQRLKARQKCRHCHQQPVDLTFLPCGHFLFCQSCGSSFQNCPACRKPIMADVKTYLS